MNLVRPEVQAAFDRWREVLAACAVAMAGIWLITLGGWFLQGVGAAILCAAAGWVVVALRRLRFMRDVSAPGVVETDEGQIGYFGPSFGGFVALDDVVDLRLMAIGTTCQWRLKTRLNEVLLIPTTAAGAERLFDAFAALPGIDMAAVTAALGSGETMRPLWQRTHGATAMKRLDHELS